MKFELVYRSNHRGLTTAMDARCPEHLDPGLGACLGLVSTWCERRLKGTRPEQDEGELHRSLCEASALQAIEEIFPDGVERVLARAGLRRQHSVRGYGFFTGLHCRHHLKHSGVYLAIMLERERRGKGEGGHAVGLQARLNHSEYHLFDPNQGYFKLSEASPADFQMFYSARVITYADAPHPLDGTWELVQVVTKHHPPSPRRR
jgi:hypothetical protein